MPGCRKSFSLISETAAPKRFNAVITRGALAGEQPTHRSISFVALGKPCAATAYPPTTRNSTPSSKNTDNMSRKSGFSNRLSFESPRIQGQGPYQRDPLLHRQTQIILVRTILGSKRTKFDLNVTPLHAARITWPPPAEPFRRLVLARSPRL